MIERTIKLMKTQEEVDIVTKSDPGENSPSARKARESREPLSGTDSRLALRSGGHLAGK